MNIDQLHDVSVREFVSRVLPSLPKAALDDFCNPGELEKSRLFAQMPFETKVFLYRRENGINIDLQYKGKAVSIRAQFDESPYRRDNFTTLPKVWLSGIYLGEDRIGQTMYDHAFYPSWSKPKLAETFRTRIVTGHKLKYHKLDEARLRETCRAIDHAALHLSSGVTPKLDMISPVFSPETLTPLPALGSAARMRRISAAKRIK